MINRRVAWHIADAFVAKARSTDVAQILKLSFSGFVLMPYRAVEASVLVFLEKMRLLVAVAMVCLMWAIAVVPLIVHGERIIPRAV